MSTINFPSPVSVRKARREDCPRLMELIRELAEYEKAPEAVTVTLSHFEESGFGARPVWEAFVATTTENGRETICGFALYYIRYSTWKGQRLYLEDLIVTETMRCHGIGTQLINALIQEGKEKGYNGMVWQVLEWNEPAIAFYKKLGASFDPEWINCSVSW
jgi:GNAT superfamily N-acetyltransferase